MRRSSSLRLPRRGERCCTQELRIFTGNAHKALAQAICDYLGRPLGLASVYEFSNENIFVKIKENVRNRDVFIVQPVARP